MSKERPIRFIGPMVRAILDGTKTQTRRIVKNATGPFWNHTGYRIVMRDGFTSWETHGGIPNEFGPAIVCPFGKPGDRLWVRETHYVERAASAGEPGFILYRATNPDASVSKWRPSIHMPRWASRITLEVVNVRVERLNAISGEDAIAEGVSDRDPEFGAWQNPKEAFADLRESINGSGSWDANPWVWVVEFNRIKP